MTRHWQKTRTFSASGDSLPERGRVLILSPCENIHDIFEPAEQYSILRGRSANLGTGFIEGIDPDVIVAPVLGQDHDILEIAQMLRACQFKGTLCAVSRPPIMADLVLAELRHACPGLTLCSVQILDA